MLASERAWVTQALATRVRRPTLLVRFSIGVFASVSLWFAIPPAVSAAPSCGNLTVHFEFWGSAKPLDYFGSSPCYGSKEFIQDSGPSQVTTLNPNGWFYTMCHRTGAGVFQVYHPGATRRVYDDTGNDSASYAAELDEVDQCASAAPIQTDIDAEYMAPSPDYPCSNYPSSPCWQPNAGTTNSNGAPITVVRVYPELYKGNSVENLLSDWNNGAYNMAPPFSVGTLNATPFIDSSTSFYGLWSALEADAQHLCNDTQINYLSVYATTKTYTVQDNFATTEGTNSAENAIRIGLNNCF